MQSGYHTRWNISRSWSSAVVLRRQHFPDVRDVLVPVWPGLQHVLRVISSCAQRLLFKEPSRR